MESDHTRERGFLSHRDRDYLRGESDIEPRTGHERNVRRDIRRRVQNTFLDFSLVLDELRADDWEQIFDSEDGPTAAFDEGLADTIAFIFAGVSEEFAPRTTVYPVSEHRGTGDYQSMEFLPILYRGLYRGYLEHDILLKAIELETEAVRLPGMKTIERKLKQGETLDPKVAARLIESGRIDSERVNQLLYDELLHDSAEGPEESD